MSFWSLSQPSFLKYIHPFTQVSNTTTVTKHISLLWSPELPKRFALAKSRPAFLNLVVFLVAAQCLGILIFREISQGKEWEKKGGNKSKRAHAFCVSSKKETQTLEIQFSGKEERSCVMSLETREQVPLCKLSCLRQKQRGWIQPVRWHFSFWNR